MIYWEENQMLKRNLNFHKGGYNKKVRLLSTHTKNANRSGCFNVEN